MTAPWIGKATPRQLADHHFEQAARVLGCQSAVIRAVWEVEAAGRHFLADGSVIRRFEPHHFPRQHWAAIGFSVRPGEAPWRASLRLSSDAMFLRAAHIDLEAACRAASWGAPQIMGFNHKAAGFDTPVAMVQAMSAGAPEQLRAFTTLLQSWGLASALAARDWRAFARRYNGSGQVEEYARRMEAAWRRHSGSRGSPVVLRVGARGAAVEELQRALEVTEDDGAFGPATLAAVQAFQKHAGLVVDGVVGARTWEALADPATQQSWRAAQGLSGRYGHAPAPPTQDTPLDLVLDKVRQTTAAAAGATAAATAAVELVPEQLQPALFVLLGLLVAAAAVTWLIRRVRA